MNYLNVFLTIGAVIAFSDFTYGQKSPVRGIAAITGKINGNVTFTQKSETGPVLVEVSIAGLSPGKHGFHIHEKGDLSGGCVTTGDHYNPDMVDHGGPHHEIRHVGDLGNIEADKDGNAVTSFSDELITLYGERSIIGRAIVVREDEDDLGQTSHPDSKVTGNSGDHAGCAVIGIL